MSILWAELSYNGNYTNHCESIFYRQTTYISNSCESRAFIMHTTTQATSLLESAPTNDNNRRQVNSVTVSHSSCTINYCEAARVRGFLEDKAHSLRFRNETHWQNEIFNKLLQAARRN